MSEKIAESAERDGGQAFPQPVTVGPSGDVYPAFPGMTLRDWFAGQALAGIAADGDALRRLSVKGVDPSEAIAQSAFAVADSMIVERRK